MRLRTGRLRNFSGLYGIGAFFGCLIAGPGVKGLGANGLKCEILRNEEVGKFSDGK